MQRVVARAALQPILCVPLMEDAARRGTPNPAVVDPTAVNLSLP